MSDPRRLTRGEARLLEAFLAHDMVGVDALRAQTSYLLATSGCTCGCGTIELLPQDSSAPVSTAVGPVEVEGTVIDDDGSEIGGLLLFVEDGLLSSLEVYSYLEGPLPLPDVRHVRWSIGQA